MKVRYFIVLIMLSAAFESLAIIIAFRGDLAVLRDPLILAALGLAAFRGGRAISYNAVFEWLRLPFTAVVPDSSGAGMSVESKGSGIQRAIGELLCCPVCTGTWVALILAGLLVWVYPFGLVSSIVLAAAGIAEIIHWFAERNEWQGRQAREEAGTAWLLKNRGTIFPVAESETGEEENRPVSSDPWQAAVRSEKNRHTYPNG